MTTISAVESLYLAALEKATPRSAPPISTTPAVVTQICTPCGRALDAQQNVGSFLQTPAAGLPPTVDPGIRDLSGSMVGPYKLLQQIGEGGMGIVYMAEQTEPVRRQSGSKDHQAGHGLGSGHRPLRG